VEETERDADIHLFSLLYISYKIIGDSLQLTSTLVLKEIIQFGQDVHAHSQDPANNPAQSIGKGIGLSFALFFMVLFASVCQHRFFFLSMSVGGKFHIHLNAY